MSIFKLSLIFMLILFLLMNNSIEICENSISFLSYDFQFDNRIVGGVKSNIEKYPFAVSIQWRYGLIHHCGGSYIQPMFILTAAHCLTTRYSGFSGYYWYPDNPSQLVVIAGSSTLTFSTTRQIRQVVQLLPHPKFDYKSMSHDIGLIKIDKPFELTPQVSFINLPVKYDDELFNKNLICTAIGWGKVHSSSPTFSNVLREVNLPLVSDKKCRNCFSNLIKYDHLCAGRDEGGVDSCQGDSGSPLLCENIQIGIVSWGKGCAEPYLPGVYSRVDMFIDWINLTISQNSVSSHFKLNYIAVLTISQLFIVI